MNIIKELRKEKGLSQQELAEAAGVRLNQIHRLEQGITLLSASTGDSLIKIAKALETTVETLLEMEQRQKEEK
jgi:transcriptional regulator with XRE-family HTH domain